MGVNDAVNEAVRGVAEYLDGDLFLFSGGIGREGADELIHAARALPVRRPNVGLVLTTYGGDPDAAYRIARFLKRSYAKVTLYIFGYCKSAGTLVALGADEIVMSDFSELGPLDVQLYKADEMVITSGLSYYEAILILREQAFGMFEDAFLGIKNGSSGTVTTRTAADIATALTVGLLAPISGHIDPLRLGEVGRAVKIALEYGDRLCEKKDSVLRLVTGYPSHSFVIDFAEASDIFKNVRRPNEAESQLEQELFRIIRSERDRDVIACLSSMNFGEEAEDGADNDDDDDDENGKPRAGNSSRTNPASTSEADGVTGSSSQQDLEPGIAKPARTPKVEGK